jgi:hypothetical protein
MSDADADMEAEHHAPDNESTQEGVLQEETAEEGVRTRTGERRPRGRSRRNAANALIRKFCAATNAAEATAEEYLAQQPVNRRRDVKLANALNAFIDDRLARDDEEKEEQRRACAAHATGDEAGVDAAAAVHDDVPTAADLIREQDAEFEEAARVDRDKDIARAAREEASLAFENEMRDRLREARAIIAPLAEETSKSHASSLVHLAIKCPNGTYARTAVAPQTRMEVLFAFARAMTHVGFPDTRCATATEIDSHVHESWCANYLLVTRFPRREYAFERHADTAVSHVPLANGEILFVEPA